MAKTTRAGVGDDGIFDYIGKLVEHNFGSSGDFFKVASETIDSFVSGLQILASTYIAIWIVVQGYQFLMGVGNRSFSAFLYDLFKKFIVIALVFFYKDFFAMGREAINALAGYASGGESLFSKLQTYFNSVEVLAAWIWEKSGWLEAVPAFLAAMLICGCGLITGIIIAKDLIGVHLSNVLLLALFPVAIATLLLNSTSQMFRQFINLVIANVLTLVLYSFIFAGVIELVTGIIEHISSTQGKMKIGDTLGVLGTVLVLSFIFISVNSVVRSVIQQITQVSAEESGAAAIGRAGVMAASSTSLGVRSLFPFTRVGLNGGTGAKSGWSIIKNRLNKGN